jgi:cyanobactin maturation PatA/PatG family protease
MKIQSLRSTVSGIRAALAEAGAGTGAVKLGIVDGLPDLTHPTLRDAAIDILHAMVPPDAGDADAHATAVCSLIFGTKEPVRGLAPGCTGLVLPLFFRQAADQSLRPVSQLDLARAISFALERDVSIINISAGQKSVTTEAEGHLAQVLAQAAQRRVLIVAAAGNDGCPCIHIPAIVETVIAVGALDTAGRPLATSNWGEPYSRNGLLAPGGELPIAALGGGASIGTGTSYATAVVSGVAALLLTIARREGYEIDPLDIRNILIESALPCELEGEGACDRYLAGTLDASAALAALHRAGRSRRPSAAASATQQIIGTNIVTQQLGKIRTGEIVMSESSPVGSVAVEPSHLSLSACSCQQKPEEEATAKLEQHGSTGAANPAAPPVIPPAPLAPSGSLGAGLAQQACSCGGGEPPQIVFAIGALWFDFGSEARYDALVQQLDPVRANNPVELIAFLRANPQFVVGVTFILMQEQIPLYAIQPAGPFAAQTYNAIFDALESSLDDDRNREQRVSIPGMISGSTRLLNGMTVPVVYPDLRGMYKWQSHELIAAAKAAVGSDVASNDQIFNFLNRVYYELRNFGVAPQDRALNFAATNAFQSQIAFAESAGRKLELDTINVVKSPICRPDSDCWDVELQMFDPENERRANRVYRYTIDVSEVLPVTVGTVRTWAVRA